MALIKKRVLDAYAKTVNVDDPSTISPLNIKTEKPLKIKGKKELRYKDLRAKKYYAGIVKLIDKCVVVEELASMDVATDEYSEDDERKQSLKASIRSNSMTPDKIAQTKEELDFIKGLAARKYRIPDHKLFAADLAFGMDVEEASIAFFQSQQYESEVVWYSPKLRSVFLSIEKYGDQPGAKPTVGSVRAQLRSKSQYVKSWRDSELDMSFAEEPYDPAAPEKDEESE